MAGEARKLNRDGYVHAREAGEYQRLRDQALLWQGATEALLDQVELGPGMSALDVGSGPGAVMRLMADRVGSEGNVTGIEIDANLGAQAIAALRAEGGTTFAQINADVLTIDKVPGAPFDLVYCRFFLMHMQDPVAALEKMQGWVKPGGVIAAQEYDFGSIAVEPLCPAMAEFNRLFEGVFRGYGRNLRAGRQLPMQFEAAGIGLPDGTTAETKFIPLKEMAAMLIGVYQGLFASAAELGIGDRARAESFKNDITAAAEDGRYYCITPILIGAWKRLA
ncbi:methyltransferase [Methyloceanibacter sp.]|uniref:methyltransferase n=1 Tax=Methyloceanibacter sp. TaxID=1965321 RepID=UPI002D69297C|nr:methyltransferase domain-containing protein [Methyloceanibacter sp.]HZP10353.1 methyltransferase domain-containing protein [Methyloceanibacter sp.]